MTGGGCGWWVFGLSQMKQWGSERGWVFYAELQGRKDVMERGNVIEDRGLFYFIEDSAVPPEMDLLPIIIVTTNERERRTRLIN